LSSGFSLEAEDYGEIEQKEAKGTKGWWSKFARAFRVDLELRVDRTRNHRRVKREIEQKEAKGTKGWWFKFAPPLTEATSQLLTKRKPTHKQKKPTLPTLPVLVPFPPSFPLLPSVQIFFVYFCLA
jgi:hypothetical protein